MHRPSDRDDPLAFFGKTTWKSIKVKYWGSGNIFSHHEVLIKSYTNAAYANEKNGELIHPPGCVITMVRYAIRTCTIKT